MIEVDEEHAAVHEPVQVPALLHGAFQHLGGQVHHDDAAVLVEIEQGVGIRGHIGRIDGVQTHAVLIPVIRVALQAQAGAMDPAGHHERAAVEHLVGIGAVAAGGGLEECLVHRLKGDEGHQLVEIGDRLRQFHLQGSGIQRPDTDLIQRHCPCVGRFRIADGIEDEGVLRGGGRVQRGLPGKLEIVGRDGLAIAPAGVLAQVKHGAGAVDLPALGKAGHDLVIGVIAQQPFHDMPQHHAADGVGGQHAVELRRFLAQIDSDFLVLDIHRTGRAAAAGTGQAGDEVEGEHQDDQNRQRCAAIKGELPAGGTREAVVRAGRVLHDRA